MYLRQYPTLREQIARGMGSAPELTRFVNPPWAFTLTYSAEVELHHRTYEMLKQLSDAGLVKLLGIVLPIESVMEDEYKEARERLSDSERQLLGFEIYGEGGRHYFFRGVLHNYGIESGTTSRTQLDSPQPRQKLREASKSPRNSPISPGCSRVGRKVWCSLARCARPRTALIERGTVLQHRCNKTGTHRVCRIAASKPYRSGTLVRHAVGSAGVMRGRR